MSRLTDFRRDLYRESQHAKVADTPRISGMQAPAYMLGRLMDIRLGRHEGVSLGQSDHDIVTRTAIGELGLSGAQAAVIGPELTF